MPRRNPRYAGLGADAAARQERGTVARPERCAFSASDRRRPCELGSSGAVLERDGAPLLLIDCGPETLTRYLRSIYSALPPASISRTRTWTTSADSSGCSIASYFDAATRGRRAPVRARGHRAAPAGQRVADYPMCSPRAARISGTRSSSCRVSRGFWHEGLWFDVFPTRHHAPMTSFGVALRGAFAWTGDTRPIPEMLAQYARARRARRARLRPGRQSVAHRRRRPRARIPRRIARTAALYHYDSAADGRGAGRARLPRRPPRRACACCTRRLRMSSMETQSVGMMAWFDPVNLMVPRRRSTRARGRCTTCASRSSTAATSAVRTACPKTSTRRITCFSARTNACASRRSNAWRAPSCALVCANFA